MANFELQAVTNRPVFSNKELERATRLLMECDSQVRTRQFDIASILGRIESQKLYQDDGFANTAEYAMQTFGMQKTLAYELIDIGVNYTREVKNAKGKVIGHCSNLVPPANPEQLDFPVLDFTPNKIGKMKVLGREKVLELIQAGDLTPRMTFKEIADVVKLHKAKPALTEPEQPATEPEQPATEPEQPATEPEQPATEPEQPATEPEQPATEPATEPEPIVIQLADKRGNEWDALQSDQLIAELRKRGFNVYRNHCEYKIDWRAE